MAQIRSVIQSFDTSNEEGKLAKESVEILTKLGEAKLELFEIQIRESLRTAGSEDNKTIPIESIIGDMSEVRAFTSTTVNNMVDKVQELLNSLVGDGGIEPSKLIKGVASVISKGLGMFLGENQAESQTIKKYYIIRSGMAIIRVDMMAWFLEVKSQGIKAKLEKITAFKAVTSTVDLSKVKLNTFLAIYQQQLKSNMTNSDVLEELEEVKKVYKKYTEEAKNSKKSESKEVEIEIMPDTAF